jgi:uncharacterized alkaline shock family protein YloU
MIEENKVDLGSIQIHKKVIADIAASAMATINGVSLDSSDITSKLGEWLGRKNYQGINVRIDKSNQVTLEVKVNVRYGLNIPDVAREVQDTVRAAIEKTMDIDLKDINVNIQGIQRDKT